eukprot:GFUD01000813.1.p2 GENE.GFUD01000813.1~~GFUD01000813.1.p2  ORF type:complete len:233 (+),score=106.51 GFUD01000813.1:166-864(+)
MLETAEVLLVTVSAVVISLSFVFCFTVTSHADQLDLVNNNQEAGTEATSRRRKKKSDQRRGSVTLTRQSSVSTSRRSSMSITGQVGGMVVQQEQVLVMQTRLVIAEKEMVEIKMRNLKLLKMTENLEEKNRKQEVQIGEYEKLRESHLQLKKKDDQSKSRIAELETRIVVLAEAVRGRERVEEEKEKLEKMLTEQQKIIKLALARILPRKGEVTFCQEHVGLIRGYENKYFY